MHKSFWDSKNISFLFSNFFILLIQFFLIYFFLPQMSEEIPLWMTSGWGKSMLAFRESIFIIPLITFLLTLSTWITIFLSKNFYQLYLDRIFRYVTTTANIFLAYGLYLIIKKTTYTNLFFLDFVGSELLNTFFISFIFGLIATPIFITYFKKKNLVTDPKKHQHPGMILKYPSARGGGLIYALVFGLLTLILTKFSLQIMMIVLATILSAVIGILDDIYNTSGNKKFKFFSDPLIRLFVLMPVPLSILIFSGISIDSIGIPFYNTVNLKDISWSILGLQLYPISFFITMFWFLWVINLLSWSNGVDGQYSGIIVIAGLVVGFLSIRFLNLSETQFDIAKIAFISSGVALGLLPYTWNPSKIMWGFGAISAGVVLSSLSIISSTKISISILVILIPFLDAVISIARRLVKKQNPFKGDKSHLHHLLLNRGWSVKQIAMFYWVSTFFLGLVAYFSSEKDLPLILLTIGGVISFGIILLNLGLGSRK